MKRCCLEAPIPQPTKNHVTARWIQPDRKAGMKMLNKLKPIIPKRILRSRWRWRFMERLNPKQSGDEFQVLKEGAGCWQVGKYVHCRLLSFQDSKCSNIWLFFSMEGFLTSAGRYITYIQTTGYIIQNVWVHLRCLLHKDETDERQFSVFPVTKHLDYDPCLTVSKPGTSVIMIDYVSFASMLKKSNPVVFWKYLNAI